MLISLIHSSIILALFAVASITQLHHEQTVYKQKRIDGNVYVNLERKRKKLRNAMHAIFYSIGFVASHVGLRSIPAMFAGMVLYWILFDGLYAMRVKGKGFWFVGFTSKVDSLIATEKRSRTFKIIAAVVAAAGLTLNLIL